jgi:hypothetical protein
MAHGVMLLCNVVPLLWRVVLLLCCCVPLLCATYMLFAAGTLPSSN